MSYSPLESAQLVPGKMYHVVSANAVTRNGALKQGKNGGEPMEFVRIHNSGALARAQGLTPMSNRPAEAVFKVQDEMGDVEEYKVTMYPGAKYVKNASSGGRRRKTRKGKRSSRKTLRRRR